jgi:hypothetical protein
MIEQIIENLQPAIGQKLTGVLFKDNGVRLIFEDDVIIVEMPVIECRCIGCLSKKDKVKER